MSEQQQPTNPPSTSLEPDPENGWGSVNLEVGSHTPQGVVKHVATLGPGAAMVNTATHAGFQLSDVRNAGVPAALRTSGGWYELALASDIPRWVYPELFAAPDNGGPEASVWRIQGVKEIAEQALREWIPNIGDIGRGGEDVGSPCPIDKRLHVITQVGERLGHHHVLVGLSHVNLADELVEYAEDSLGIDRSVDFDLSVIDDEVFEDFAVEYFNLITRPPQYSRFALRPPRANVIKDQVIELERENYTNPGALQGYLHRMIEGLGELPADTDEFGYVRWNAVATAGVWLATVDQWVGEYFAIGYAIANPHLLDHIVTMTFLVPDEDMPSLATAADWMMFTHNLDHPLRQQIRDIVDADHTWIGKALRELEIKLPDPKQRLSMGYNFMRQIYDFQLPAGQPGSLQAKPLCPTLTTSPSPLMSSGGPRL